VPCNDITLSLQPSMLLAPTKHIASKVAIIESMVALGYPFRKEISLPLIIPIGTMKATP